MTGEEMVAELMEMRRKVVREMPHLDCRSITTTRKCFCYKHDLIRALLAAEYKARETAGMELF